MIRTALLCALVSAAASAAAIGNPKDSRTLRRLEDADDISWISGYSLMYENCFHSEHIASFRLCPDDNTEHHGCTATCEGGGEYLVDLFFFIDAFTEAQMGAHEYRCEMARENCYYDDEDQCYQASNLKDCGDKNEDENGFDLQDWLECNQLEDTGYYVGPYCSEDNYNIHLGVFTDQDCTEQVDADEANQIFQSENGYDLPYASESIIASDSECANCNEHGLEQDQNDGDQEDEDDVLEQCEELYAGASNKCEHMDIDSPDYSSCGYIAQLQSEEHVIAGSASTTRSISIRQRNIFIGVSVALLSLVLGCCAMGYCMHAKQTKTEDESAGFQRAKENLL